MSRIKLVSLVFSSLISLEYGAKIVFAPSYIIFHNERIQNLTLLPYSPTIQLYCKRQGTTIKNLIINKVNMYLNYNMYLRAIIF